MPNRSVWLVAGLHWTDPGRGIGAQIEVHGLLTHESEGVQESGVSGTLFWDPEPGSLRGAVFSLAGSVNGSAMEYLDSLMATSGGGAFAGLTEQGAFSGDGDGVERMEAKLGYGLRVRSVRRQLHGDTRVGGELGRVGPWLECGLAAFKEWMGLIRGAAGGDARRGRGRWWIAEGNRIVAENRVVTVPGTNAERFPLDAFLEQHRALWNAALQERIEAHRKVGKSLSLYDQAGS